MLNDQKHGQEQGDLLSRLLLAGHGEEMIRDMAISFIMAGRDTTSSAMTWLFWLLSKNEIAEEMILEEANSLLENGEKEIDFGVLKEMDFLKACICESMRLYTRWRGTPSMRLPTIFYRTGLSSEKGIG